MKSPWTMAVLLVLYGTAAWAQAPLEGPVLSDLMQTLQYAELVRSAGFSRDQLRAVVSAQAKWLEAQRVPDEMAGALREASLQVAGGRPVDSALLSVGLGERLRQVQEQSERTTQALVSELRDSLAPEQREALIALTSPTRGLEGLVEALRQMRRASQPAWEQMRGNMVAALSGFGGRRAEPAVSEATIGGWLDRAREMPEAEFEAAATEFPREWAQALAPEMMRHIQAPGMKEQRVMDVCRRLLTDPPGRDLLPRLVEEAGGTAPPAPGGQPPGQGRK